MWSFGLSPAVRCVLKKVEFTLYDISEWECGMAESIAADHVNAALGDKVNESNDELRHHGNQSQVQAEK